MSDETLNAAGGVEAINIIKRGKVKPQDVTDTTQAQSSNDDTIERQSSDDVDVKSQDESDNTKSNELRSKYDESFVVDVEDKPIVDSDSPTIEEEKQPEENVDKFNVDFDDDDIELVEDDSSDEVVDDKSPDDHVKLIFSGKSNAVKKLENFKPPENVSDIKLRTDDQYQRAVVEQYLVGNSRSKSFTGPKLITRVVLPYSGIYMDISSFTNTEMLAINRVNNDTSFAESLEVVLSSAWDHTVSTSIGTSLEFSDWLKAIKLPDLQNIYYAIFNSNNPGENDFYTTCDDPNCGASIKVTIANDKLSRVSVSSRDDITQDIIDDIKKGKPREEIESFKIANKWIEKSDYLPDSKFKVYQGIPNLSELLNFLKFLKEDLHETDDVLKQVTYPISSMAMNNLSKSTKQLILAYKFNLYTRSIIAPIYENAKSTDKKKKVKVTYVKVKDAFIPHMVNNLSKDDTKALVTGKRIRELMIKDGIIFKISNYKCDVCKLDQVDLGIDMIKEAIAFGANKITSVLTD